MSCEGLTPPELSIFILLRAGRERESALEMVYALFPCLLNWILENSALNHYIPVRREQALRGSMASVCSLTWASSGLFCETGYPAFKHHHQNVISLMVLNPVCTFESLGCFFKTYGYWGHSPRPVDLISLGPGCVFLYFLPGGMTQGWRVGAEWTVLRHLSTLQFTHQKDDDLAESMLVEADWVRIRSSVVGPGAFLQH